MAKNFASAGSANLIKDVAKASSEKANVIQVKMVSNENLLDYPKNHEDCNDVADLENSMRELGFTDPIEVTAFGMEEGKYTIVSGHRRRVAGVNVGYSTFPCIIKTFDDENAMRNYVLLSNSQRDTAKDPLLFCKRYKMHEEYLKESGFKGSVREEIAKRLGISSQQADRYNQFNKIILPVWDMVRDEVVGMSSVLPMATHSIEEQEDILKMLNECLSGGGRLTRDTCDKIIKGYREGKITYAGIIADTVTPITRDSGLPLNTFMNTEPGETKGSEHTNRNNEIRREYDPLNPLNSSSSDPLAAERLTKEDYETIETVGNSGKEEVENTELTATDNSSNGNMDNAGSNEVQTRPQLTDEEKKAKRGLEISRHLESLEKCFNDFYTFESSEVAEVTMRTMSGVIKMMYDELCQMGSEYDREKTFKEIIADLNKSLKLYE